MTPKMLVQALRGFCRRKHFRPFMIELTSGSVLVATHREAVAWEGNSFVLRRPDGLYEVFAAANVARLFDPPPPEPER